MWYDKHKIGCVKMSRHAMKRIPLSKLMDLKVDFAFKKLFGTEENKKITIVFLNAILKRTGRDAIKEVTFNNVEIIGAYKEDKQSRLDILVTTEEDYQINVEIQFANKYDMVKRSIYYWSQIYGDQIKQGMTYMQLKPTIVINILNFNLLNQTDLFHTTYHLYEDQEKFRIDDVMEFHFIEIPKLLQHWKADRLDPWNDVLARWLLLLGMVDQRRNYVYEDIYKELEAIAMNDEYLQDAFSSWTEISINPEELSAYRARMKEVLDAEAFIKEAELREQAAQEKGIEKGIGQGIQLAKEENAFNLLAIDMDIETVAQVTGLTLERVQALQEKLKDR